MKLGEYPIRRKAIPLKKRFFLIAAMTLTALLLSGAASQAKVRIRVWHPWGGTTASGLIATAKQYEKQNPNVSVEMVSVPNQIETNEKFFVSMAAGKPPEVILVDTTQVIQWAVKGVLTNLDKFAKEDGVKESDFWNPSYKQCLWKGKMYALPYESDPNFPIAYNKAVFSECGLPGAPKNFEDFESYARKIDRTDSKGDYSRAGAAPMSIPWWGNILYTWGWAFGADFYDDNKDIYKLNHPKAISAMDWLVSFYVKRGGKFSNVAGQGYSGLAKGKIGMMPVLSDFGRALAGMKVKNFDWGYGFITGPGESPSAWVGGWTMAIPANSKNQKESWKFIKWICREKEGTLASWKNVGWLPSAKTSPVFSMSHDIDVAAFAETLKIAKHYRPVSLATPIVFGEMEKAGPAMLSGKKSAAQALNEANVAVQKELDRLMAKLKKK